MAARLEAMGQPKYTGLTRRSAGRAKWNGNVSLDYEALRVPYSWKSGRMIFVNSMSDLFQDAVPLDFIKRVFDVMDDCKQHTFQVLTKRSTRLLELSDSLNWPTNVWMGVSVENADFSYRIDNLRKVGESLMILSLEPLSGDLGRLNLDGINWAIAGGESGPGARPMDPQWVRSIRDQCIDNNVAFHFKQWGGVNKKRSGRLLDGRTWDEFPVAA
jgi:protein gp37